MTSSASIPILFTRLGARLMLMNPTPQPVLTRVILDDLEALPMPDIPFAVLRFEPQVQNTLSTHAMSLLGRMDYSIEGFIFIAGSEAPQQEKHNRAKYWPPQLLTVLSTDTQLNSTSGPPFNDANPEIAADHIGGDKFAVPFQFVEQQWGADGTNFFGIRFTLQVTQKFNITAPA